MKNEPQKLVIYSDDSRISAMRMEKYNKTKDTITVIYVPQVEMFDIHNGADGKLISIANKNTESGLEECESEFEALKFAMALRSRKGI